VARLTLSDGFQVPAVQRLTRPFRICGSPQFRFIPQSVTIAKAVQTGLTERSRQLRCLITDGSSR